MDIETDSRKDIEKQIAKVVGNKIGKDIELSIYNYSKEYAEIQDTPYLLSSIYDDKSNEIKNVDELERALSGRCDVVAIIKCDKVTFNGGKYGYKWTVAQLKVYTSTSALASYAFIEDSDHEDDTPQASSSDSKTHEHVNVVEDSEEDEEDEEDELDGEVSSEEEEEEAKPPTPKKKVVRRRKTKKKKEDA